MRVEYIDVSDCVIPKRVLDNNFRTHMLFRCTSRKFAEELRGGKLFLNTPRAWIEKEKTNCKGQGDSIEGVFYVTNAYEDNPILKSYENDSGIERFRHEKYVFLRRKAILDLKCTCFYGVHDKDFTKRVNANNGKAHLQTIIPVSYFTDFSLNMAEEDYTTIPYEQQPVVANINKPHVFFERIRDALRKLGVQDDEFIISPVDYIQMHSHLYVGLAFPRELLLKDIFFEHQKEVRLIIFSKSKEFNEYLEKHNNTIELGPLDDIVDVLDYYFEDLTLIKEVDCIRYNLPKPIITPFEKMTFSEIIQQLAKISINKSCVFPEDKVESVINLLQEISLTKYKVNIWLEGNSINVDRIPDEYAEEFNRLVNVKKSIEILEKNVNDAINKNNIEYAIQLCNDTDGVKEITENAKFLLVDIYRKSKNYNKMLQQISICIERGIKVIEVLSIRSNYYYEISEYEKALLDLESMQEIIGYDYLIYGNKGINYIALKRYSEAIAVLTKAIDLNNNHAFSFYNRGVAYFHLGDINKAKHDMEEAIRIHPTNNYYVSEYKKCFGSR